MVLEDKDYCKLGIVPRVGGTTKNALNYTAKLL